MIRVSDAMNGSDPRFSSWLQRLIRCAPSQQTRSWSSITTGRRARITKCGKNSASRQLNTTRRKNSNGRRWRRRCKGSSDPRLQAQAHRTCTNNLTLSHTTHATQDSRIVNKSTRTNAQICWLPRSALPNPLVYILEWRVLVHTHPNTQVTR